MGSLSKWEKSKHYSAMSCGADTRNESDIKKGLGEMSASYVRWGSYSDESFFSIIRNSFITKGFYSNSCDSFPFSLLWLPLFLLGHSPFTVNDAAYKNKVKPKTREDHYTLSGSQQLSPCNTKGKTVGNLHSACGRIYCHYLLKINLAISNNIK